MLTLDSSQVNALRQVCFFQAGCNQLQRILHFWFRGCGVRLPAMSFGSFGCRIWQISKSYQLITPSALIGHFLPGEDLQLLFFCRC